jgi:hypothetical protein
MNNKLVMLVSLDKGAHDMADELTTYLTAHGATPVDGEWLKNLVDDMSTNVVPAIVAEILERENLAAELRYAPVRRATPSN